MSKTNGRTAILTFHQAPKSVVSLVPSISASMMDLGLGERLLGITDFCPDPVSVDTDIKRIGGPKNPDVAKIVDLQPELVIANFEENTLEAVESLEQSGLKVWVTFPCSTEQAMEFLWTLVQLFRVREAADQVTVLEATLEWTAKASRERPGIRYFCPIWFEEDSPHGPWWMTFNQHTYSHDVLQVVGGENVFAERTRQHPLAADIGQQEAEPAGERDTRYPRISLKELRESSPDLILLPGEPFHFDASHIDYMNQQLQDVPAVESGRIELVDGSLITWFGTRLANALSELPQLFRIP
jgi:ABC-type Fe3+-hydroxamate transport system substrate-binding protein